MLNLKMSTKVLLLLHLYFAATNVKVSIEGPALIMERLFQYVDPGSCVDDNSNDQIANVVLDRHNEYRMKHGVPRLKLSSQLSAFATEWAVHCSEMSSLSHRTNNPYGENLDFTYYPDFTITKIAKNGVDIWYNEIQNYTFGTEKVQYDALHFTQIVWKSSRELGVGIVRNSEGGVFMVCNYNPPGNIEYAFSWNVFKPIN